MSYRTPLFFSVPVRPRLSVGTHDSLPRSTETHERGPPRLDHPGTWDIGTTYRRLVLGHGLVVSVVFPPHLSASEVFPLRLSASEVFVLRLSVLEASRPRLPVSEVFVPRLPVLEGSPPQLPVPTGARLLFLKIPVLSILVPVSARYPTPHPPVRLGCRYCCGSSYVRCVPRPNPIQKPKMRQIHLFPLPMPGKGIPLPEVA